MSRAQGIRRFSGSQTCTPRLPGNLMPELETHGLHCEQVRRFGKPSRTALIEHQP
jgi:hypothetical protein